MTNHAITQTQTGHAATTQPAFSNIYRNWKARRQVRKLQDRDDQILDDIGVMRDEIAWASDLPLSVNAAHELHQTAYRRRKEQQLMWL